MRILVTLLLCLPIMASAQTNQDSVSIKKLADEIMTNGKAYDLLRELTKKIGGRLAGSPQQQNAAVWGKRNLEALHPDQVFMQPCKTPSWQRGGKDFAAIVNVNGKAQNEPLAALALGNSLGSNGLVEAELLAVANFDELEKRKEEVKGKIVYYHSVFNPTRIQTFVAYGESGMYRGSGASRAAKYGAVGVMIHSLSTAPDNEPHTGGMRYDESLPKIPAVALGPNDAKALWEAAKTSKIRVQMQTYGFFLPDADENNVVAELKGSQFPEEIITIGGHLDSWDVNEGAHDDGAGIVQTMEVLRAMKASNYVPKRTIRFVLFANEENGLRGGSAYAAAAKDKKEKHIFALESDEGGFTPRGFSFTASSEKVAAAKRWLPLLKPYGTDSMDDIGGGSDISPLNRQLQVPLCGFMPDPQRYFDLHHARTDVFENVNKRELLLGAVNIAGLIYLVDTYGF